MKGLIIKSPWIDLILEERKTWEIRGSKTKIRGKIALIKSGTGKIFGTIDLIGVKPLNLKQYQESFVKHYIPKEHCTLLPYKRTYAWILTNPVKYVQPVAYKHPKGAVIWVNLNN